MLKKELESLLAKYNISLDPSLDEQHLIDYPLLEKLLDLAGIKKTEVVLEVGAGCGTITDLLAKRAKQVYAMERSGKFLPVLKDKLEKYHNVHIIIGNAINVEFPKFDKIVSNLPYSICEALMQKLIHHSFRAGVFIVPMSFVRVITTSPENPKCSRLSMMISFFYDVQVEESLKPDAYFPTPKVHTALIKLTPKTRLDFKAYVFQGLFLQGDKKTKNALRKTLIDSYRSVLKMALTKREAKKNIDSYGINPRIMEIKVAELSSEEIREIISKISDKLSYESDMLGNSSRRI